LPLHGYSAFAKISTLPLEDLNDYTNFIYSYHAYLADVPNEVDLQALREAGMGVLLKLDKRIVEESFNEAELRRLKTRLDPYKDVVIALCIIDEPYKPKKAYTEEQLRDLVHSVKAIFPDYVMYVNFLAPYYVEQATGAPFPGVPDNIDLISTDIYIHLGQTSGDEEYKMRVGRNLDIILDRAQGRPVFYAAPAYGLVEDETSWPSPHQAQLDYELFIEYGLMGLGWFFYDDMNGESAYGASHFPDVVEKHIEIGGYIFNSSN
jgi:hypothetical protein